MVDIVERLRRKGERVGIPCPDGIEGCLVYHFKIKTDPDCAEAADEIERLREQVKELATALEFEANYDGHKLLARSALQQKEND